MNPTPTKPLTGAWRPRGSHSGGTVTGLALSPAFAGDKTVFASTMAGIYRSLDGGKTWRPANVGFTSPFAICVAISSNYAKDGIAFAGSRSGGLFQTFNGGDEWHPSEIWGGRESVQAIAVSPGFGADQTALLGSETAGVFRTTTGGKTWSASNFGLLELGVLALAFSPTFDRDETAFCVTTDGFYRTPNAGRAWRESGPELAGVSLQCVALSPTFADDGVVVVGSEDEGIYLSADGGRKFRQSNKGLDDVCVNAVALSPDFARDRTIVAGTNAGPYVSRNGGASWKRADGVSDAVLALAGGPAGLVLAGTANVGVVRSEDGGETWLPSSEGLAARLFVQMVVSPDFGKDKTLFTVTLDQGIAVSSDGGESWDSRGAGLDDQEVTSLVLSPDYAKDKTAFVATNRGVFRSVDACATWSRLASGADEAEGARAVSLSPAFDEDGMVFAVLGGQTEGPDTTSLVVSRDRGDTWETVAERFDRTEIVAIACSPEYATDRTVYAGTFREGAVDRKAEVVIWRSEDGGKSWVPLTSHHTPGRWLTITMPPTYARDRAVFVGVQGAVLRPMAGPMAAPRPGRRQLWFAERVGRPNTAVVSLVASSTYVKDGTLYAGTSDGVYVSRNGGLTWSALNDDLTNRAIVSLALSPNFAKDGVLFAASLGGAIWTLTESRAEAKA
ncbi:MAG: hypothetical protein EPO26_03090 [Chloroflexota bacterium]|nr:MAG: hypothetical protein EPO26_03090 [Chloroflexota bacterium]